VWHIKKLINSYGSDPVSGIDLTTPGEMAERQIEIKLFKIFNFYTITSAIHQIKAELVVNPATMSDFKKALQRKQTMLLSEDRTPHTNT
jgi:hypothetical protein